MLEDNRTLQHRKPCKECPYRRKSPAGYLGGYPLEPYRQPPSAGVPTTCHMKDKGAADPATAFCSGSLAVIANDPKVTPAPGYELAALAVEDRETCFGSVEEFAEYHKHTFIVEGLR